MKVDNIDREIRKQCEVVAEMIYERFIDTAENQEWLKRDTERVGKVEVPVKPQQVKRWMAEQMRIVARPALNALQQIKEEKCQWMLTKDNDLHEWVGEALFNTECGHELASGKCAAGFRYCPFCGKKIEYI